MSGPQAKRKVMGRIDLSSGSGNEIGTVTSPHARPTARVNTSSPAPPLQLGNGSVRKARVSPSSIMSPSGGSSGAHVRGLASGASSVRSPLHGSSMYNASLSPSGEHSPAPSIVPAARTSGSSTPSSRYATRSPSPSRMFAQLRPGQQGGGGGGGHDGRSISPGLSAQRAKARPASAFVQHDGARGLTMATAQQRNNAPRIAKVNAPSLDVPLRNGHVRAQSSFAVGAAGEASRLHAQQQRSRSPSPTLIKSFARDGRRISHGSSASVGTTSSVTGQQPQADPTKRPSLASLHVLGSARGLSEHSNPSGLESPFDIPSPTGFEGPSSFKNGSLTSPPGLSSFTSSSLAQNAVASPTMELDAEAVEAKTNRKILDLEITNKSLLAINSGLEVMKLKQAREIRELKRRVREGRGLAEAVGLQRTVDLEDGDETGSGTEEEGEESDEEAPLSAELEEAHQRCKGLIDAMVDQARIAILSKYEHEPRPSGNRVLHPAEVDELRMQSAKVIEEGQDEEKQEEEGQEDVQETHDDGDESN